MKELTFMKELMLRKNQRSTTETYETFVHKTNNQLIESRGNFILTDFNISLNYNSKCLPLIYQLHKNYINYLNYKNLTKVRFKIVAQTFFFKSLSISLTFFHKLRVIIRKVLSFQVLSHSGQSLIINLSLMLLKI